MEVRERFKTFQMAVLGVFIKKSEIGGKNELKFGNLKIMAVLLFVVFVLITLIMPEESNIGYTSKLEDQKPAHSPSANAAAANANSATNLWQKPRNAPASSGSSVNHNQSMVLTPSGGNAKTQVRAGIRVPVRILEKFAVSESAIPILAESITEVRTESGLNLPAGTKFYGEASHQRDSDRASVRFTQISLPSGEFKPIRAIALGKDGQSGVVGNLKSDAMKNTAGQMITSFVGGFAAGSMQTDVLGGSKGGVQNGLLNAVATTAKDRAQSYGEKLKHERQWVEVPQFAEADAVFSESLKLGPGGEQ